MVKLFVAFLAVAVGLVSSSPALPKAVEVDPALLLALRARGSANALLTLTRQSTREVLSNCGLNSKQVGSTEAERLTAFVENLEVKSSEAQSDLLAFLEAERGQGVSVQSFWITNKVLVRGADLALVEKLSARSDISKIQLEKVYPVEKVRYEQGADMTRRNEQPNIQLIRAPPVWAYGNRGEGVVAATIDTGVSVTHEALAENYREDHGWFDPISSTLKPSDPVGHGTHTMGILVGQKGIGVAPGAKFITCRGCDMFTCSQGDLLKCGEWVLCPTDAQGANRNCSLAPQVVSNSWGGGQDDDWMDDVLLSWRQAKIFPVFSMGGGGPGCGSTSSPADSKLAFAVGGSEAESVSSNSGHGPTTDGRIKPEAAAPAFNISSASAFGDGAYVAMTGTSMAAPHAAGVALLVIAENRALTVAEVTKLVTEGAVGTTSSGQNCGGIPGDEYPNNDVGWGRVDALNSVAATRRFSV